MGLPSSWVECCLKDIGKIVSGGTPKTAVESYFGATHAWITPADLTGYKDVYISRGKRSLTEAGLKHSSAVLMPKGSVLFSSRAPIGYVAISSNPISTNQGFKSIIPHESVVSKYVYYYLKFSKSSIEHLATGTTFKEISARSFGSIKFVLPPLAEQRRIVEKIDALFSELDKGVDYLNKVKDQLKTYRQAVLKWAFEDGLDRGKNHIRQHKTKTIGELADEIVDCPHSTPKWTSNGKLCLRTTNFKRGHLDLSVKHYVSESTFNERTKRLKPQKDDILYSREGAILGIACLVPDDTDVCLGQRMMLIRIGNEMLPRYLMHYLNSPKVTNHVARITGGSASPHVNVRDIKQFKIPTFSISEQICITDNIESRLSVCDKLELLVDENIDKAEALRQSILKMAFDGRLVSQDPNDEPAEKLLERIKAEQSSSKSSIKRGRKHA